MRKCACALVLPMHKFNSSDFEKKIIIEVFANIAYNFKTGVSLNESLQIFQLLLPAI